MKVVNYFQILLFFLLLLSGDIYSQTTTKEIKLSFDPSEFSITEGIEKGYSMIYSTSEGFSFKEDIGEPALPYSSFNILVDYGAEFESLEYSYETILFAENLTVQPILPPTPTSLSNLSVPNITSKEIIYFSKGQFPNQIVEFISKENLSQYTYLTFLITPFVYYPEEKKLLFITDINISITYHTNPIPKDYRWDNGMFANMVRDLVINSEEVTNFNFLEMPDNEISECEYLIITSEALTTYFEPLLKWKAQKGITSEILSTEYIYSNYEGETNQLKIKNCILDYYQNKGLIWVLLGGDDAVVPKQNTYIKAGNYVFTDSPCDLFYGCFDNQFNWNADGDEYFGEVEDNVDMAPEVIVGRAPIRTSAHVTAFVDKTINYEKNPQNDNFIEDLLLGGVKLWSYIDGISDSELKCELMWSSYISPRWSGNKFRFYDTNTDFGGPSYDVTAAHFSDLLNTGYHYLYFSGHGSYTGVGMEGGGLHGSSNASSLTNLDAQGIFLANSCLTNGFDKAEPCYSEAYIRNPNGGCVAIWTSSRYGWDTGGQYHGSSTLFADYFFVYLFTAEPSTHPYQFGAVANQVKIHFLPNANYYGSYRWLIFAQNITGDPELNLFTYNPQNIYVKHSKTIPFNSSYYSITNSNCENGIVTLTTNDTIVSKSIIINGNCLLNFEPIPHVGKEITLTITGHNYKPYIADLYVSENFEPLEDLPFENFSRGSSAVSDIDSDGDLDIIICGKLFGAAATKLFLNDGSGNFYRSGIDLHSTDETSNQFIGVYDGSISVDDCDNDGDIDILLTGSTDNLGAVSYLYENIENSYFKLNEEITLAGLSQSYCSFIDYNNDGNKDIFLFGKPNYLLSENGITQFYQNKGNNQFEVVGSLGVENLYYGDASWGDFDNDCDFDLAIMGINSSGEPFTRVYSNEGESFNIQTKNSFVNLYNGSVEWFDYDNDGYLDLILTGLDKMSNKKALLYKNNGNFSFSSITNNLIPVANSSITFGDCDNDGDFDLFITGLAENYITKFYLNESGEFDSISNQFYPLIDGMVNFGDFDKDKDLDLFLGGNSVLKSSDIETTIWSNLASRPNIIPNPPNSLNLEIQKNKVILSWSNGNDTETPLDGLLYDLHIYQREDIERNTKTDSNNLYIQITSLKDTSWVISNLPEGRYFFRIKTVDTGFETSVFSSEQMFKVSNKISLKLKIYLEGAYR